MHRYTSASRCVRSTLHAQRAHTLVAKHDIHWPTLNGLARTRYSWPSSPATRHTTAHRTLETAHTARAHDLIAEQDPSGSAKAQLHSIVCASLRRLSRRCLDFPTTSTLTCSSLKVYLGCGGGAFVGSGGKCEDITS